MTIHESKLRLAANPADLEAIEALLERFPSIDEDETQRIAKYLKTASSLDVGLLSSNKAAWDAAERLRAARPELFRMGGKGWLVMTVITVGTALMLWWLYAVASQ